MTTGILTTLSDKYEKIEGRVYINGLQALVLACMVRRRVDAENGIKTAGFVSGYRGSPVGTLDSEFWKAKKFLDAHDVVFQSGVNEDLAATSVWGTQQVHIDGASTHDGVFGMWYGKGAGIDRCGDVMRHAHGAGTTPLGGVLAVCGDDHTLKSSSQAYHSELFFMDKLMPVLYPSDIQEALDYAILGWELSRFSGCWVGFKILAEVANSTSSLLIDINRYKFIRPDEPGLSLDRHLRWPDPWVSVEKRHYEAKLPAALAFARANRIDKEIVRSNVPRMGIVTAGKSYLDVLEALGILGLSANEAADMGISIYKVGMPWPLAPEGMIEFACRQKIIFVIEEKRGFIE